jgi:uncharacterized delta-60 repeat protein
LRVFHLKNKRRRGIMLHLFKIIVAVFIIWLGTVSFAQQWAVTHGSPFIGDAFGDEKAYSIAAGTTGEAYVTGYSDCNGTGTDICTIKYNEFGETLWVKTYNGGANADDKAYAITVDKDQNIYVTGYSTEENGTDIVVIKYNNEGEMLWVNHFNGPGNESDKAYAIVIDNVGGVYVGGYMTAAGDGKDFAVIKYSNEGDLLWAGRYPGAAHMDDEAVSLAMLGDNAVVLTGFVTTGSMPGDQDIMTVKFDVNDGSVIWNKSFSGTGMESDKAYAIVTDGDSYIYLTGYATYAGTYRDIITIKYDSEGNQLWAVHYDAFGFDDAGSSIALSGSDVLIVTGKISKGIDKTKEDFITIRYNTLNGSTTWDKKYDGIDGLSDFANSVVISHNKNSVYVTGVSTSNINSGSEDMYTVKYDAETGSTLDSALYNTGGSNDDVAYDIAVDSLENVYITGYTEVLGGDKPANSSWLTCKYGRGRLTVKNTQNNQPKMYALYQNYPNPFNPSTVIKFDISAQSKVSLKIYDVLGKEVAVLVKQDLKAGNYTYSFRSANLSTGVYFYELTAGSYREVKKMMIVK